ncbi:MAG: serine/threonine protein kinase [Deltaproteobacteria bacterium]|nr:serine/threonine protein kinase [Deltaproteobacteria bacterium]
MAAHERQCPVCGSATSARACAEDGAATVRLLDCTAGEIRPGTVLDGRIAVGELIGRGGFAKVWGARDFSGTDLAIKVMSKAYVAADIENIRRFVREADITSRLVHGNTIRVFDVGQTEDGQLLLVMERLRGHALTHRLRHLRHDKVLMAVDEAIQIGVQVLSSLTEAHGAGLVHRDLKPDNIFLHRVGKGQIVKVIDFGIAHRDGSEMTRVGQVLGTPAYMSPEQARGAAIDGRADLYSLGVILFQLFTGRVPFPDEDNPLMTMMHHVMSPIPDPRAFRPELGEAAAELTMRALAKEAEGRFEDAATMRDALRACLAPASAPSTAPRRERDRRAPRSAAQVAAARRRHAPPVDRPPPLPSSVKTTAESVAVPVAALPEAPPPLPAAVPLPATAPSQAIPPPPPSRRPTLSRLNPPPPPATLGGKAEP